MPLPWLCYNSCLLRLILQTLISLAGFGETCGHVVRSTWQGAIDGWPLRAELARSQESQSYNHKEMNSVRNLSNHRSKSFPTQVSRQECSSDNPLTGAFWDPKQKIQLSYIQTLDLQWNFPGKNTGVSSMSSSRGSSWPRGQTWVSCIADRFFTIWITRETPLFTY